MQHTETRETQVQLKILASGKKNKWNIDTACNTKTLASLLLLLRWQFTFASPCYIVHTHTHTRKHFASPHHHPSTRECFTVANAFLVHLIDAFSSLRHSPLFSPQVLHELLVQLASLTTGNNIIIHFSSLVKSLDSLLFASTSEQNMRRDQWNGEEDRCVCSCDGWRTLETEYKSLICK